MEYIVESERGRCGDSTRIASFFFHSDGEAEQRAGSALGFYRSVCFQLLETDQEMLSSFMQATNFEERYSKEGQNCTWRESELGEHLTGLLRNDTFGGNRVFIYVDALDEAGSETAQRLTTLFQNLHESCAGRLGICVASRPYSEGGNAIFSNRNSPSIVNVEQCNRQDIHAFVKSEFLQVRGSPDRDGIQRVRDRLVEKANGVFQWLKWSAPKALALLNDGEPAAYVLKQIEGYPRVLEGVYEHLLSSLDDGELDVALRLFECLATALGPLTTEDMRVFVCLEADEKYCTVKQLEASIHFCQQSTQFENRVQRLSHGLIRSVITEHPISHYSREGVETFSAPNASTVLQFDHDSVKDFMLEKGLRLLERRISAQPIETPTRHLHAALKCIRFLQLERTMNRPFFVTLAELSLSPLQRYAYLHWAMHAREAEKDYGLCDQLLRNLDEFEDESWEYLIEFYDALAHEKRVLVGQEQLNLAHVLSYFGLEGTLKAHLRRMESSGLMSSPRHGLEARSRGQTPLMLAAIRNQTSTARILLQCGANPNAREYDYPGSGTALHIAVQERNSTWYGSYLKIHARTRMRGTGMASQP